MKEEIIKVINDAISSIAMYALDTNMSNIDNAIDHIGMKTTDLRNTCGDEIANHFEHIALSILNKIA